MTKREVNFYWTGLAPRISGKNARRAFCIALLIVSLMKEKTAHVHVPSVSIVPTTTVTIFATGAAPVAVDMPIMMSGMGETWDTIFSQYKT